MFSDEPGEEVDMSPVVATGVLGERGEALRRPVQLQVAEIVFDLFVDAHEWPPS